MDDCFYKYYDIKLILFSSTRSVQLTCQVFFPVNFAKFLKTPILTEHLRWLLLNVVEIWSLKNKLIKTLSQKISITEIYISKKKTLLKQCQKEVIYEYILAFAGWWSIFWEVVGSGGCILASGMWQWVVVHIFWLVVGGGGWWLVMVNIFLLVVGGSGWWQVMVDHGGWWHSSV